MYINNLSGEIAINGPIGAASLLEVDLSDNQLSGSIPESFGSLLQLEFLSLRQNNLAGGIPPSIARLPSLKFLWLWSNNLTGVLPAELGKRTPLLRDIQVDDNKLSGPIPAGICDHHQLWVFTASGNRLNGSIPESLAACRTLMWLEVADNELSGEVPAALWTETKLISLILQNNGQLTGTLPKELYWNLTRLYLDNNRFGGPLPVAAARLRKFHIANNLISGSIPAELVTGMPQLKELNLAGNMLSGVIP